MARVPLKPQYHKVDPELRALQEENARLKKIIGNQALNTFLRKHTVAAFYKLNEDKTVNVEKMKTVVLDLDKKLNRLEERFIEDKITKEMFLKYTEKAKAEKLQIETEIEKSKDKCSNLQNIIEAATTFASKFSPVWTLSDYYRRQKLQFMLFPEESSMIRKKMQFEPQEQTQYLATL